MIFVHLAITSPCFVKKINYPLLKLHYYVTLFMPKYFIISILIALRVSTSRAQIKRDTSSSPIASANQQSEEQEPQYPGGIEAFHKYITNHLHYPEVALLIGVNGAVRVQFTVEKDGSITHVEPLNCIGAGCESEAVRVIKRSRRWKPGLLYGQPDQFEYIIPISFVFPVARINMRELDHSDYGFVFKINDKIYTLPQASHILGRSFSSDRVLIAEPLYDASYRMKDRKETFLVTIKTTVQ